MTEDRNVFESLDSIIAMVTDSGEDLTADRIKYLYNTFLSAIDEAKKEDEFYRDKFIAYCEAERPGLRSKTAAFRFLTAEGREDDVLGAI